MCEESREIKDCERREKNSEKLEAHERTVIPRPRPTPKAAYCRLLKLS